MPPYAPTPGQYPAWPPIGPPKKNNGIKWALAAAALIAVIAVAVAVTLAVTRSGSSGNPNDGGGSKTPSGIASANDTGPVTVITDEPTCAKFTPINSGFANQAKSGWNDRDPSIPVANWSPDQRAQYMAMGTAMRNTADQFVPLARQTPHRVVRELYEQFIAYAHAYADSLANYTASDDHLALVATNASSTIYYVCQAISEGSASTWGPSVPPVPAPSHPAKPGDPANPQQFLSAHDSICANWNALADRYHSDAAAWLTVDSRTPATQWTPDQKSIIDGVEPVMSTYADNVEQLGRGSSNAAIQDFAMVIAQYLRAYVRGLPTYIASDSYLAAATNTTNAVVVEACKFVGG
ncbi:hypothetical protein [Mycobacterium kyorinense]|uniref:hypothetical protein n=1 Tax=Mycobacterium kyorinense TaxID=487514 RepID=UPI001154A637|nr:hypothetical protein [Mycobacterium kyorinense]